MGKKYQKAEILQMIQDASADMAHFYAKPFINYRGKTSDTDEYDTEIIAEWCCDNISVFQNIQPVTRKSSYKTKAHDGTSKNSASNRQEELIAHEMFRQGELPVIGKILDYQTPLKDTLEDQAGKIDLLAYDGKTLHILELKRTDSEETMLRCVLEGYTYLRTVDQAKLLADFNLPGDTQIKAHPFVFWEGAQHKERREGRLHLERLMHLLDCEPYYIIKEENGKYTVI